MSGPDILMVVVAYRSIDLTRRCVESLQAQDAPVRFVVWDNASDDGTAQMLADMGVEHVASPENRYWTPAINQAIKDRWDGETYIGWMNNDAALDPTAARELMGVLRNPKIGLVAPMTSNIGGPQDIASNPEVHDILKENPKFPGRALAQLTSKRVTFVLGACSMTRKDVWDTIGPLEEGCYLGADDFDLAVRVREHGYEIHVVRSALCHHAGHQSSKTNEGRRAWDVHGAASWKFHDEKWAGFHRTEEEAIRSLWGGQYCGWDHATGWDDVQRAAVGLPPLPPGYRHPGDETVS